MKLPDSAPIAAIATAPGRGGIGVVRISGADLSGLLTALLGQVRADAIQPRMASYGPFLAADGSEIDRGLVIRFPAPHSYTGEDVIELQGHGGPVVMQMLLRRALEAGGPIGLRLAEPGEFTQRAFLNDKLDLAQAEAVADLIDASTEQAARSATRSLAGAFSEAVHALVEKIIHLRMLVEATLDFPEEEIDFLQRADALGQLTAIRSALDATLATARQGALLREGMTVVLAGEPNVGKSSLLNALAGAEVAIVTDVPGTTRDRVAQSIQIQGVPLNIIDTAGLRETSDAVEKIGIERSWDAISKADVVLHLTDVSRPATATLDEQIAERLPAGAPIVRVINKIDLSGAQAAVEHQPPGAGCAAIARLSARTGEGVDVLRDLLLQLAGWQGAGEGQFIARERHLSALRGAREHLAIAEEHARQRDRQLDLFAEELRLAQERLDAITGEFTPDDLLGVIFSRFCIGK